MNGESIASAPVIASSAPQPASDASGLARRLDAVLADVAASARKAGRRPEEITVVAVSKTVARPAVDEAFALGVRHFGENRVQDAARKFAEPLTSGATLHLIGQLQSNKARTAVALFDIIESVDRPSLIDALEKEAARHGQPIAVLLEINVAREPQKAGCAPERAAELMGRLVESSWLQPRGLMTMAPLFDDPEDARPVFVGLRELRDELARAFPSADLSTLSMGMSNDFRVAIEEGATTVRIGRAIFGA
jgi:pyridoxal phosphate enzyme (YggS family)